MWWHTADHLALKNARSIKQDGANLRAQCVIDNIDFLVNEGEEQAYKEFVNGLQVRETRPVARPPPVTAADLLSIANVVDPDEPHDMQLWLMLLVTRSGLLRAGELCGRQLRRAHVHNEGNGVWRIDLHKTKTSRLSADASPFWLLPVLESTTLTPRQNLLLDGAALMTAYLSQAQLAPSAPLFPALDSTGAACRPYKPMSYNAWLQQFKETCTRAGIARRSLHSLRAGGATDLYVQGVSEAMVKKAGRWVANSTSAQLYNRPGMALASIVQRAHQAEIVSAARRRSGRRR